jgi:hypothetical protein
MKKHGVIYSMKCITPKTPIPRPRFEVADVFRPNTHLLNGLTYEQWKVVNAIISCRSEKLGGHKLVCLDCGHEEISYNSCRNRHCPKCQGKDRMEWVKERVKETLPIRYFHIVFTIPEILNGLIQQNKKEMYEILFKAVGETLNEAAKNPKNLGARIGFFSILHTWGQNLLDHPHIHCVVTGGGLNKEKTEWIKSRDNFLISVKILGKLFRGKYLYYLKKLYEEGKLGFHGKMEVVGDEPGFNQLLNECYAKKWVVYSKKPFDDPIQVLKYLGRYTHRVAISNSRIINYSEGKVSFLWKDYRDKNKKKVMSLSVEEFMRRFLLHVLPKGFKRIRFYGILCNGYKKENLRLIRYLLRKEGLMVSSNSEKIESPEYDVNMCPKCKSKHTYSVEIEPVRTVGKINKMIREDNKIHSECGAISSNTA